MLTMESNTSFVKIKLSNKERSCYKAKMKLLPLEFVLNDNDVRCGRGNTCYNHLGNLRFRQLVKLCLTMYIKAKTKHDKTIILFEVINTVQRNGGNFIKLDFNTSRYYVVSDFHAVSVYA